MFHTFVETSDEISKAYFPCNFVVIIQLILFVKVAWKRGEPVMITYFLYFMF